MDFSLEEIDFSREETGDWCLSCRKPIREKDSVLEVLGASKFPKPCYPKGLVHLKCEESGGE